MLSARNFPDLAATLSRLAGAPLGLRADTAGAELLRLAKGEKPPAPPSAAMQERAAVVRGNGYLRVGTTAIVPIIGLILQRPEDWLIDYGWASCTDRIAAGVSTAAADPQVQTVVLDIESPGGLTTGTPEAAAAIREAAALKPVIAWTDSQACSAAYWLAAAAGEIVTTPSAIVGSLGAFLALYDYTGYLEQMGIRLDLFRSGAVKGLGVAGKPLDDSERAFLQGVVDTAWGMFREDITATRPQIDPACFDARWVFGAQAAPLGLVDQVVGSRSEFLAAIGVIG